MQCWFHDRQRSHPLKNAASPNPPKESSVPDAVPLKKAHEVHEASKCIYIAGELFLTMGYDFHYCASGSMLPGSAILVKHPPWAWVWDIYRIWQSQSAACGLK